MTESQVRLIVLELLAPLQTKLRKNEASQKDCSKDLENLKDLTHGHERKLLRLSADIALVDELVNTVQALDKV